MVGTSMGWILLVFIFYNMWGEMSRGFEDFVGEIGRLKLIGSVRGYSVNTRYVKQKPLGNESEGLDCFYWGLL
jgi:hypothetical protein